MMVWYWRAMRTIFLMLHPVVASIQWLTPDVGVGAIPSKGHPVR
jgi:hypothetical protein